MKKCIHQYLTYCKTNPQPPGFADFLRGTKTLYLLSMKYNYSLLIDYDIHPIFKYFKYNEKIYVKNIKNINTLEFLPPLDYKLIYNNLEELFNDNNDIHLLTNSFYNIPMTDALHEEKDIKLSCEFIKEILEPGELLSNLYKNKMNEMNFIDNEQFIIIHLRFHDNCLFNNDFDITDIQKDSIINIINNINNENNDDKKIIIISNFYNFIQLLKNKFNNMYFTNSLPIHLGSLDKNNTELKIQETLIDLLFLSKSSEIYSISQYGGSGFSWEIAQIYNIPIKNYSCSVFNF